MTTTDHIPRRATSNILISVWVLLFAFSPLHAQPLTSGDERRETAGASTDPAPAQGDAAPVRIQFSGFGTLGFVYTDAKDVRFVRPSINHHSRDNPDVGPDTVIGVQGNLSLGQRAAIVVQAISRKNTRNSYEPHPTLAFISYAITPNLTVRAGRLRMPFSMLADTLDINYANPWIRPSPEIYSMFPFYDLDGADILINNSFGEWSTELRAFFGKSSADIYRGGKSHLRQSKEPNITITVTNGKLTLFAAHGSARLSVKWGDEYFQELSDGLHYYDLVTGGSTGKNILQDFSGEKGRGRISSVAVQWDHMRWLLIAQYALMTATRYCPNAYAWDVTAGRRFGSFMPYLTYAKHMADDKYTSVTGRGTGFPPVDEGIRAFTASRTIAQSRVTLGLRWDFYRNTAFKAEFSHTRIHNNSWGSFFPTDLQNPRMGSRRVNTIGASIDVTF